MVKKFDAWLEGSLFFRTVSAVMDFIGRVASGSFIVAFFTADYNEEKLKHSRAVNFFDVILNKIPKPFGKSGVWPKIPARILNGSGMIKTVSERLGTPIASPEEKTGLISLLYWFGNAVPVWTMLAVTAAAPLIGNSMPLAVLIAGAFLFTWLSRRFPLDLTTVFLLLFIGVQIFTGVTSFHFNSSIQIALITAVMMLSLPIINACIVNRRQVDVFFFIFAAASLATGLAGIYQYLQFNGIMDSTWVDSELFANMFRATSTFANPNVYGTFLLLAIPLSAAMVLYSKNLFLKICALGTTGILLFNLMQTNSRGCYLAIAAAALFFILLTGKRVMVFFIAGLITLPVTVPLMLPYIPASVLERLMSITNLSDSSTSYRLAIWQGTIRLLQDFWAVGVGQGIEAYNTVYPYYSLNAVYPQHTHNVFLQIFTETGIIGLIVFLGILAAFFRTMASYMRREKNWRCKTVAMAFTAGTVGFLFQGIFDHLFFNYRVMLIFYIYMGLGIAFAKVNGHILNKNT